MHTLTPTQQKDLEIYRTTGELGSLSNIFTEDCTNKLPGYKDFLDLYTYPEKVTLIICLLSRTLEGQAVMPFLDVGILDTIKAFELMNADSYNNELSTSSTCFDIFQGVYMEFAPKTLDELMHKEFTKALRLSKGFEIALETITRIYIDTVYV